MRTLALLLLFAGACTVSDPCEQDPDAANCGSDTDEFGNAIDTADTGEPGDTGEPTDTGEPPPPPVEYSREEVTFVFDDAGWQAMEGSVTHEFDDDGDYAIEVGFEVTGSSDLEVSGYSHVVEDEKDEWFQYFEGIELGGLMTPHLEIDFPIDVTIAGTSFPLGDLVDLLVDLPFLEHDFSAVVFDTFAFFEDGEGEAVVYEAAPFSWSWSEFGLDPGSVFPYVDIEIEIDVNFTSFYTTLSVDTWEAEQGGDLIGEQYDDLTRHDISELIPYMSEPASLLFHTELWGYLLNELQIDGSIDINAYYDSVPISVDLDPYDFDIDLSDPAYFMITFDPEEVEHTQLD